MLSRMEERFEQPAPLQEWNYRNIDAVLLQQIRLNGGEVKKGGRVVWGAEEYSGNDSVKRNTILNRGGRGGRRVKGERGRGGKTDHGREKMKNNIMKSMDYIKENLNNQNSYIYENSCSGINQKRNENSKITQKMVMEIPSNVITVMTDPTFIVNNLNLLVSECIKTFIENDWISSKDCHKKSNNSCYNIVKNGEMAFLKNELVENDKISSDGCERKGISLYKNRCLSGIRNAEKRVTKIELSKPLYVSKTSHESNKSNSSMDLCLNNGEKSVVVQRKMDNINLINNELFFGNKSILSNNDIYSTSANKCNSHTNNDKHNSSLHTDRQSTQIRCDQIDADDTNDFGYQQYQYDGCYFMDKMSPKESNPLSPLSSVKLKTKKQNSCSGCTVSNKSNTTYVTSVASTATSTPIGTTAYPSRSSTLRDSVHTIDNVAENDILSLISSSSFSSSCSFSSSNATLPLSQGGGMLTEKIKIDEQRTTDIAQPKMLCRNKETEENKCCENVNNITDVKKECTEAGYFFTKDNAEDVLSASALVGDDNELEKVLYRNVLSSAWNRQTADSSKASLAEKFVRRRDVMTRRRSVLLKRDAALIADMKLIAELGQNENSFYNSEAKNNLSIFSQSPPSKFRDILSSYITHLYWGRRSLIEAYRQENLDLLMKVANNEVMKIATKDKIVSSSMKRKTLTPQKSSTTNSSKKGKYAISCNRGSAGTISSSNSRCNSITRRMKKQAEQQQAQHESENYGNQIDDKPVLSLQEKHQKAVEKESTQYQKVKLHETQASINESSQILQELKKQQYQLSQSMQQEVSVKKLCDKQKQQQDQLQFYRAFASNQIFASPTTRSTVSTITNATNHLEPVGNKHAVEKQNSGFAYYDRQNSFDLCRSAVAIIEEAKRAAESDDDVELGERVIMKPMMMVTRLAARCPNNRKADSAGGMGSVFQQSVINLNEQEKCIKKLMLT